MGGPKPEGERRLQVARGVSQVSSNRAPMLRHAARRPISQFRNTDQAILTSFVSMFTWKNRDRSHINAVRPSGAVKRNVT